MSSRRVRSAVVITLTVAVAWSGAGAGAAPDTNAAAARAIESNGRRTAALSEALNGAEYRLEEAKHELERARTEIAALRVKVAEDRARLAREGAGIYRNASEVGLLPVAVQGNDATARRRVRYGAAAADATRRLVDDLIASEAALTDEEQRADAARRDAEDERDRLAQARDELAAADARQQALLASAPPEVVRSLNDAGAATTGPTAAPPVSTGPTGTAPSAPTPAPAAPAPTAPAPTTPAPTTPPPTAAPAPSGGAAAAVAFAHAQLGKPYAYAAAGPESYDCSGLTMAAWRAGGISLPHYSGAQYSRLKKVSMSALQPGDLIFWGPGGSDHVAISIGGGKIISAPYTGAVVRIQGIWGSPIGAARP